MSNSTNSTYRSSTDLEWLEKHLDDLFVENQPDPFAGCPPTMTFEQGLRAWQHSVQASKESPSWSGVIASIDVLCGDDLEAAQSTSNCCDDNDDSKKKKASPKNSKDKKRGAGDKDVTTQEQENCERCGPDVTRWLVNQMNQNKNHSVIKTMRENKDWVKWIPFFNLGYIYGFLSDFRELVRSGGPWDFKSSQTFTSDNCPSGCPHTVTLCDYCFFYDVPGNIHYGWVGRASGLRSWLLHYGAAAAQDGGVDDPKDTQAIDIGINMWDSPDNGNISYLCPRVRMKRNNLALRDCPVCTDIYAP